MTEPVDVALISGNGIPSVLSVGPERFGDYLRRLYVLRASDLSIAAALLAVRLACLPQPVRVSGCHVGAP